jgi:hypothetical protein
MSHAHPVRNAYPPRNANPLRHAHPVPHANRLALAVFALVALLALGGCGGGITAPDLFIVSRTGSVPGAKLTLLVNEEGGVHCNGGPPLKLSDKQLVLARAIQEELHDPATKHLVLAPRPGSVLSYSVRDQDGTVRFSDNSAGQPSVLRQLQGLVLEVAQGVCHLRM